MASGTLSIPYAGQLLERWRLLKTRLRELAAISDLASLVDDLFPDGVEPVEDLRQIALGLLPETADVVSLATELGASISQPQVPIESTEARVMSFHKSKGLTAQVVVLAGLVDGLIPLNARTGQSAADQMAAFEEQRRLFYVGLTRTTEVLVLSSYVQLPMAVAMRAGARRGRFLRGGGVRVFASQFLGELGPSMPTPIAGAGWRY